MIVSILWIPFRAESLQHAADILRGLGNFGTDTPTEFYQTMLPRIAALAETSGLFTGDVIVMAQKGIIFAFVLLLLLVAFLAKDATYFREKYCDIPQYAVTVPTLINTAPIFSALTVWNRV